MSKDHNQELLNKLKGTPINSLENMPDKELYSYINECIEVKNYDPQLSYLENKANLTNNIKLLGQALPSDEYKTIRMRYIDSSSREMAVGQKKEKFEAKIQEIKNLENSEKRYNKIKELLFLKPNDHTMSLEENKEVFYQNLKEVTKMLSGEENKTIRQEYMDKSLSEIVEGQAHGKAQSRIQKEIDIDKAKIILENNIRHELEQGFENGKPHEEIAKKVKNIIIQSKFTDKEITDDKTLEQASKFLVDKSAKMYEIGFFSKIGNIISEWCDKLFNSKERAERKESFKEVAGQIMSKAGLKETTDKNPEKDKFANQVVKDLLNRNKNEIVR